MTREVRLGRSGLVALVDDEDFDLVAGGWWAAHKSHRAVYARKHWRDEAGKQRSVLMHNLIMGVIGVDHINHDGLDNRRENLRIASQAQNRHNSRPVLSGSSCFKGVYWHRRIKRWVAAVGTTNRGRTHLGYFSREEDAAHAYDAAALERYGDRAFLNFPAVQHREGQ